LRAVSSRAFSMADFEGSRGRGLTMVALLPFSRSPIVDGQGKVGGDVVVPQEISVCGPIE
jgi:hypothetical protein